MQNLDLLDFQQKLSGAMCTIINAGGASSCLDIVHNEMNLLVCYIIEKDQYGQNTNISTNAD